MEIMPTFTTRRLTVRPRTMDDLEACLAMDRDPHVTRFIDGPWNDPVAPRAFVEHRIRFAYPPGMGYWSILFTGGFIGWILLTPLNLHGPEVEIGWRLVRHAWHRGYAAEAAQPVLDHALHTLRLPEIIADIDPANTASVSVARKLGMRYRAPALYAGRPVHRWAAGPQEGGT